MKYNKIYGIDSTFFHSFFDPGRETSMKAYRRLGAIAVSLAILLTACQEGSSTENSSSSISNKKSEMTSVENTSKETETTKETDKEEVEEVKNPYEMIIPEAKTWSMEDLSDENFNLKGVEKVETIGLITGDGSPNMTRTRFRVGGTDLGIPVIHNDQLYLWFGDTFWGDSQGHPMAGGLWRSNVLAISDDTDFSDGLEISDMIGNKSGSTKVAMELLSSKKRPGNENTVIPTGSVSIDGKLYVYFMSVKEWGKPGHWTINYGGLAVSEDDGESFKKLDNVSLDPDKFGQVAAIIKDDYVYGIGIGGGRYGNAYLMRVKQDQIENIEEYEYLSGKNNGEPEFSANVEDAIPIIEDTVGEPSVMWNEYLQEYVVTYLKEPVHGIVMRSAKELWGDYSSDLLIAHSDDFTALYGGFVHEVMTEEDGKVFYYIMSMWDPVYNSILMKVTLK